MASPSFDDDDEYAPGIAAGFVPALPPPSPKIVAAAPSSPGGILKSSSFTTNSSFDDGDNNINISKHSNHSNSLSVTLMNTETLPTYSVERFYMLSEIDQHAHSLLFLHDYCDHDTVSEEETAATVNSSDDDAPQLPELAPYTMLYLLWPGNSSSSSEDDDDDIDEAQAFLQDTILPTLQQLQTLADLVPADEDRQSMRTSLPATASCSSLFANHKALSMDDDSDQDNDAVLFHDDAAQDRRRAASEDGIMTGGGGGEPRPSPNKTRLYLVVDRIDARHPSSSSNRGGGGIISPSSWWPDLSSSSIHTIAAGGGRASNESKQDQDDHDALQSRACAEQLARLVAHHEGVRRWCHGVTVGVSNHVRAAPGLEACLNGVMIGAADRRRQYGRRSDRSSNSDTTFSHGPAATPSGCLRSQVVLLTLSPATLVGLQDEDVTDAAAHVQQCRVTAEWNGHGTLTWWAQRAHGQWRAHHGLSFEPLTVYRKIPKRVRRDEEEDEDDEGMVVLDVGDDDDNDDNNGFGKMDEHSAGRDRLHDRLGVAVLVAYAMFHFGGVGGAIFKDGPMLVAERLVPFLRGL